jgi:hypothetical protein
VPAPLVVTLQWTIVPLTNRLYPTCNVLHLLNVVSKMFPRAGSALDSTNVLWFPPLEPTAVHAVGPRHDTPLRPSPWVDEVFGLGTIDHPDPSHDSIKVPPGTVSADALPTAVQADGELQDTPNRALSWVGEVLGLATMDHTEPFHDSISVCSVNAPMLYMPTAKQADGPLHDTPYRALLKADGTLGLARMDHTEPFHDSVSVFVEVPAEVLVLSAPTAVHADGELHDTASNTSLSVGDVLGLGTMDHTEPFHDSISVCEERGGSTLENPTAVHAAGPLHDTLFRKFVGAKATLGLGTMDHDEPFHDSINVRSRKRPGLELPTAKQAAGPLHDTSSKTSLSVGEVLGLGTMVHADPFHDSIRVRCVESLVVYVPTAVHADGPLHDTPLKSMLWASETFGLGTMDHEVAAATAGPASTTLKVTALTRTTRALPNPMNRRVLGMASPFSVSFPGTGETVNTALTRTHAWRGE